MFKRAQSVALNIKIYKTNIVLRCEKNQNMFKHTTVLLSFNPFLEQQDKKMSQIRLWKFRLGKFESLQSVLVYKKR